MLAPVDEWDALQIIAGVHQGRAFISHNWPRSQSFPE